MRKQVRGSIIAFTLIVLSLLLVSALTAVTVAVVEKRAGLSTQRSVVAFQAADSGAERVLQRIYVDNSPSFEAVSLNGIMPNDRDLTELAQSLVAVTGSATCNGSTDKIVATSNAAPVYSFEISFFDGSGNQIECDDTAWRDRAITMKADGFYRQTSRVIEMDINPRPHCLTGETTTDSRDGTTYDVILVGEQCWFGQNLRIGNVINSGSSQSDNGTIERYCYSNSGANCNNNHPNEPDGGLYTWDEAMGYSDVELVQGICPDGWHIPSDADWYKLENYLDSTINDPVIIGWRGSTAGGQLRPNGTSDMEMNLAGYFNAGSFQQRNNQGAFWSSTEQSNGSAYYRSVSTAQSGVRRDSFDTDAAFSVRCIKN